MDVDVRYEALLLLMLPEATLPVSVTTLNDSGGERVLDSLDSGGLEIEMEHLRIGDSKLLDLVKNQAVSIVLLVRKEEERACQTNVHLIRPGHHDPRLTEESGFTQLECSISIDVSGSF